jgi:hypothetical protein
LTDSASIILLSSASATNFLIPTSSSVAFPIGTQLSILQVGSGVVTITASNSGTTSIFSNGATPASPRLRTQYSSANAIKTANETWYIVGDIA